jgi:hypothetical protein
MTVPLSEAVARMSPLGESERRAMGVLWAGMMLIGVNARVSKTRTSPVCWRGDVCEGACDGWKVGDVEFG